MAILVFNLTAMTLAATLIVVLAPVSFSRNDPSDFPAAAKQQPAARHPRIGLKFHHNR